MYHKLLTPLRLTVAATVGSIAVSLAVTWTVLHAVVGSPPPVAYLLAGGIPAIFVPMVVFPLGILLARLGRVSRELASLAHTDALTGLPNRRAFFERAEAIPDEANPGGHWWLNQPLPGQPAPWPDAAQDVYAALGHWGQALYVVPSQKLVIVRYADDRDGTYQHNELLKRVLAAVAGEGR